MCPMWLGVELNCVQWRVSRIYDIRCNFTWKQVSIRIPWKKHECSELHPQYFRNRSYTVYSATKYPNNAAVITRFVTTKVTILLCLPRYTDLLYIKNVQLPSFIIELRYPRPENLVAWDSIPQDNIDHLSRNIHRRVEGCINLRGARLIKIKWKK